MTISLNAADNREKSGLIWLLKALIGNHRKCREHSHAPWTAWLNRNENNHLICGQRHEPFLTPLEKIALLSLWGLVDIVLY